VALAADSAVTVGDGRKVFHIAEKLFTLSRHHPVGIMQYGNAEFMGVPWETIIKTFRAKLGRQAFNTLKEYADDFVRFLGDRNPLFPEAQEEAHIAWAVRAAFGDEIRADIKERLKPAAEGDKAPDERQVGSIVDEVIEEACHRWESDSDLPGTPPDYGQSVVARYAAVFDRVREEVFQGLPLGDTARERLRRISTYIFSKDCFALSLSSGVVIAGLGETEPFPSVVELQIEAIINKRLKYAERPHDRITFDVDAVIIPFAQHEMVDTFIEGVDPSYQAHVEETLEEFLGIYRERLLSALEEVRPESRAATLERWASISSEMLGEFDRQLKQHRQERFVSRVAGAVAALPKQELAAMAEALVSLTSFKRRISLEEETVGGFIDVAVISKGDGFVWVKRKDYVRPELNPHLFAGRERWFTE
jgi:hypothetical protein